MQLLHEFVRQQVKYVAGLLLLVSFGFAGYATPDAEVEERMLKDVKYLASKECEGRGILTKGLDKAALYIAEQFRKSGLKPGGVNGSYFQPFSVNGPGKLQPGSRLVLQGPLGQVIELKENKHFAVLGFSSPGRVTAPVIFVGYGATAPRIGYDDYDGMDVEGKIVIVVRRTPRWGSKLLPFDGDERDNHAALRNKLANAETHKAAAMILVSDASEVSKGEKFIPFKDLARGYSTASIPALHLKRSIVDRMLLSSLGRGLPEFERAIDRDLKPRSAALKGWKATLFANVKRQAITVKNVIGVLPGDGPLANEFVVVGAHYDHLGYGERGTRAKKPDLRKKIHFGADDNASGTTAVMELARRFGAKKNRRGRTLVFMAFSAEEKGLLGSRFYCNKEPLIPLEQIAAMVNLDMIGRMQPHEKTGKGKLIVEGLGTAKGFEQLVDHLNKKHGFYLVKKKGGTGPSDHDSFYRKKIPVFFFWTGIHKNYHLPSDTWEKINFSDMRRIVEMTQEVTAYLAANSSRPKYVYVASKSPGPIGNIPRLGIAPEYATNLKGLLIGGVRPGGAADKGGLKAGDLIIDIGGKRVTDINTYIVAMRQLKRGQPVAVTVLRKDKKLTLKVSPQ